MLALLRRLRQLIDDVLRQAGEVAAVGDEDGAVFVREQMAIERRELRCQLLVDLP